MKALSIRQPWAWLIVNGHKDIENRSWYCRHRGPLLIHAAKGMTRVEYDHAQWMAIRNGVRIPAFDLLDRGGIVGQVVLTDCVSGSPSPWFFGKYGFVLNEARPLPFQPMKGALGLFNVDGEIADA